MLREVPLPPLGEDAGDEAKVSFWYFEEGQQVSTDDILVEMVTDKAAFEVRSPADGRLVERMAEEDDTVSVGDVLCIYAAIQRIGRTSMTLDLEAWALRGRRGERATGVRREQPGVETDGHGQDDDECDSFHRAPPESTKWFEMNFLREPKPRQRVYCMHTQCVCHAVLKRGNTP